MSETTKILALVLSEKTVGENNKVLLIYSKEYGKMTVFANGAKKVKSHLLAGSSPFVFGYFYVVIKRDSVTLTKVDIIESFYELRKDLESLSYGLYLLEIVSAYTVENDANPELLKLLYISLIAIKNSIHSYKEIQSVFELRILNYLGFAPNIIETNYEENVKTVLQYFQNCSLNKLFKFKMEEWLSKEVVKITHKLFRRYIKDDFKSLSLIND